MSVKHCVGAVGESLLYKVIIILQELVNVIIGLEVGLQDCLQSGPILHLIGLHLPLLHAPLSEHLAMKLCPCESIGLSYPIVLGQYRASQLWDSHTVGWSAVLCSVVVSHLDR